MKFFIILILLISCSQKQQVGRQAKISNAKYMDGMTRHFMKTFGLNKKRAKIISKMAREYYSTYHKDLKGGVKRPEKTREEVMNKLEKEIDRQLKEQKAEKI